MCVPPICGQSNFVVVIFFKIRICRNMNRCHYFIIFIEGTVHPIFTDGFQKVWRWNFSWQYASLLSRFASMHKLCRKLAARESYDCWRWSITSSISFSAQHVGVRHSVWTNIIYQLLQSLFDVVQSLSADRMSLLAFWMLCCYYIILKFGLNITCAMLNVN